MNFRQDCSSFRVIDFKKQKALLIGVRTQSMIITFLCNVRNVGAVFALARQTHKHSRTMIRSGEAETQNVGTYAYVGFDFIDRCHRTAAIRCAYSRYLL